VDPSAHPRPDVFFTVNIVVVAAKLNLQKQNVVAQPLVSAEHSLTREHQNCENGRSTGMEQDGETKAGA
jgi:hypothetical protein